MRSGIKLESETLGDGREATRGDTVTVSYDLALNRGDVIQSLDSFVFTLGKRDVIVDIYFGPKMTEGKKGNWIKTDPDKGFFVVFRFYGPLEGYIEKTWVLNDFELLE